MSYILDSFNSQLLLIAPVSWRRRAQSTFSNSPNGAQNSSHYSESTEGQRSSSMALEVNETRLNSIRKRPSKTLSKSNDYTLGPREHVLIVGWRPKVTDMIREYDNYLGPGSVLVCVGIIGTIKILAAVENEEFMTTLPHPYVCSCLIS
jgi:hypothetical protein